MTAVDQQKRALLFGRRRATAESAPPLRPPWALVEPAFLDVCTACGDCIRACPEAVLTRGAGRYPEVDFAQGACTFCTRCVDACETGALDAGRQAPWDYRATISDNCLLRRQVVCQSCGDACDTEAIRFRPQPGGSLRIELQTELCTGCGACRRVCPTDAIDIKLPEVAA